MKKVPAKGKTFLQGASGELARSDESPVISNGFSSDYWMDSVEVTQEEFRNLMGRDPVPSNSPHGRGTRHPVYGVTWFDAVLYCNARSRKAGLDTVYEYAGWSAGGAGGVHAMSGLKARLDRNGFRLPTEAEWEFAAKAGSEGDFPWGGLQDSAKAGLYAWHSGNSGDVTRPVASLAANAFGLYDMAGNVMEWVNDWKGPYPKEGAVDFAGARDPGAVAEKPVKGGAFKYGYSELRPANRSATYATLPSAASEYVGFRCVSAVLDSPTYFSTDGQILLTDPFSLATTRAHDKLGGRGAKLVFVNASPSRRQLAYVDFRSSPPRTFEFADHGKVFHPSISPDGNWVAFGTAMEGVEAGSEILVRKLDGTASAAAKVADGFIPRWWVDPATRDTFLVYGTSAVDNRSDRWSGTHTLRIRISGGAASGPEATVESEGSFHDGQSRDGRWLATGFRFLKVRDLEKKSTATLFTAPGNGKQAGDTSQVCNVSIAPDSSGRILFLDFGYPEEPSSLVGRPYGIHHIAFLSEPSGTVVKWYPAPREEDAWNDLEWTNHPDYAVASATDPAGRQRNLYLLGLRDSMTTRLAGGTNLAQPSLWVSDSAVVEPDPGLDMDSLGRYNEPATIDAQVALAVKMHDFWQRHDQTEAYFIGSSQMIDGFDPSQLTTLKGLNLAFGSGDMAAAYHLLRNYILPHSPRLKLVAFSVPLGWFSAAGGDLTWGKIHTRNLGFGYDRSHDYWRGGLPGNFKAVMAGVPYPDRGPIDSLGFGVLPSQSWGPANPPEVPNISWGPEHPECRKNMAAFEAVIEELSRLKVHVVFMTFPQSPAYNDMTSWSLMGPSRTTAKALIAEMEALDTKHPWFHFYDLNRDGLHGYGPEDAYDENHLSAVGARKLSKAMDAEIRKFLAP